MRQTIPNIDYTLTEILWTTAGLQQVYTPLPQKTVLYTRKTNFWLRPSLWNEPDLVLWKSGNKNPQQQQQQHVRSLWDPFLGPTRKLCYRKDDRAILLTWVP